MKDPLWWEFAQFYVTYTLNNIAPLFSKSYTELPDLAFEMFQTFRVFPSGILLGLSHVSGTAETQLNKI